MIRKMAAFAIAVGILSACAGPTGSTLAADCIKLAADPEAQENFADMNADTESFCACLVDLTGAKSADDQAAITSAMAIITAKMEETGQGAEDVVGPMMSQAMARPDNEEAKTLMAGIQKTGNLIDEIERAFDSGTCSGNT
jgi:deferrochelatase/peroxidase EfeB